MFVPKSRCARRQMARAVAALLLAVQAHAQITLHGKTVGSAINYYAAHADLQGDTNYCTQTAATYASGASAGTSTLNLNDGNGNQTVSGKIFCTFNDGISTAGISSIGLYNLTVLDMGSAANTTVVATNAMSSFGGQGESDAPAGWAGQRTAGQAPAGADWKTGPPISVNGWIVLPNQRQDKTPYYATGDSTIIASPDGGLHWCNPYTFANHSGAPGCDSANWKADGDAPLPPSDVSYTATPSSIMWKDVSPYLGNNNLMGRLYFFDYCQNNACTGMPHGADTYLYGFATTGRSTKVILFRVPKSITSIMDVTAYRYYSCVSYSTAKPCDGMAGGNWTSTLANATTMLAGTGTAHDGSGVSTNSLGLTNQVGVIQGPPIYYCANGGCAYVMTTYQRYLAGSSWGTANHDRSALMAFPAPWGPFTPLTSEFVNPLAGFWSMLRYTLATPDSNPYHVRFVMAGDSFVAPYNTTNGSVGFQAYDLTLGANQHGMNLAGCTPYRFAFSPVVGAIVRRGLWGFFDFFSHGCYDNRTGDTAYPSLFANDVATWPSDKQLIGCFTDGPDYCGNSNPGHGLELVADGIKLTDTYFPRLELRDMAPGTYAPITVSPLTASADPEWTVSMVVKPAAIAGGYHGLLQVGPADHYLKLFMSYQVDGAVGVQWANTGSGALVRTISAQLVNNTFAYLTVTRKAGAISVCGTVPCDPASANIHIYVNGAEVAAQVNWASTPEMLPGNHLVGTSLSNSSTSGTFAGLEIYGRALSQPEIQHNYKTHKARLLASRGIVLP